jgi:hypothetical protein|tara:strand:+ start:142 stop:570 length:429 start_codon:yes stop_codon:yes gene_type:complete
MKTMTEGNLMYVLRKCATFIISLAHSEAGGSFLLVPNGSTMLKPSSDAYDKEKIGKMDSRVNNLMVEVYEQNKEVLDLLSEANVGKPEDIIIGRKCQNQLDLKAACAGIADLPHSMNIPVTIPIKFGVLEAQKYLEIKKLFR